MSFVLFAIEIFFGDNLNFLDCTDVLETVEEAETQADLPDDAEQLREPQRKENVGNSTATGKTDIHKIQRLVKNGLVLMKQYIPIHNIQYLDKYV